MRPSWGENQYPGRRVLEDNTTSLSDFHHYNLDMVNDTDIFSLQSAIAELCKERTNHDMVFGSLYMICNVWNYAKTMSEFEDSMLESVQRSWILERLKAIRRYQREIGVDYEHVAGSAASVVQDFLNGTPVPEHVRTWASFFSFPQI